MITRADVADLRVGDIVEITEVDEGCLYVHRGPVQPDGPRKGALSFCGMWLRNEKGEPGAWIEALTVVSRAPRPLYVNHDRTEPVPGDVVRDAEVDQARTTWHCLGEDRDWYSDGDKRWKRSEMPPNLRLLIDGETGQVVQ